MATSIIGICNASLRKIGASSILSLDDGSTEAKRCGEAFGSCLDDVLRQYPWPCAVSRAVLARLSEPPVWGYLYAYQLPTDCLRVLETSGDASEDYRLEGRMLLSNEESVLIRYIVRITDMNRLSASLADTVSLRLAYEIVYALTGSATQQELLYKMYLTALANEKLLANQEQRLSQEVNPWWADAR